MNPDEYRKLAEVEQRHWFYAGKREIVRYWLKRTGALSPDNLLVDCGAGTGTFAQEMAAYCRVLAIDDHAESLNLARSKLGSDRVREGTCTSLPVPDSSADILTALDVVEHIEEDQKALVEFSRVLRPGGVLIITVPALMWLWSDWDEVLHHFRRYTRRSLKRIIPMESFEPVHINYVNVVVLPIVFLVRKVRSLRRRTRTEPNVRSEDMTPPSWVNAPLKWLFVKLACQRVVPFPAGVGLLAVLRRR